MEYIKNTTDFHISEKTAVSLGKFDGIHRGHVRLTESLKEKKKLGLKTVIFTFDISPKQRITGKCVNKAITTNSEKMQLFAEKGMDYVIECPFTPEFMRMEPEDFVEMIVQRLHIKSFVVGTDFHYGYKGRGDYHLLQRLSGKYGYDVEVVDKVQENGRDISSTYVRKEILAGRMEAANRLLGYRYFVQGTVVHGNEIGRTIGIPTANLIPDKDKLLPPYGVYVTRTVIGGETGRTYEGITNVGLKPTIEGSRAVGVETHLFDFDEQIYGKEIKVEFLKWVRPEKKFDSFEELQRQMNKDLKFGINYYTNVTEMC